MSDINSGLPVRTEAAGDIIAKLADATTPSQQLAISAAGEASVQITQPIPAGSNNIGQIELTDGTNVAAVTASSALKVDGSGVTQPVSGTITADQGTSPWVVQDQADGPVAPGTAASFSQLAGGQYNATPPTVADTQQAALQISAAGRLLVDAAVSSSDDHDYGAVGASTLRTAAQIGNASGAADFDAGATGAQTLRVEANQGAANATPWNENIAQIAGAAPSATNALPAQLATAGAFVSSSNPLPVIIDPAAAGTAVCSYKDASAIAADASDNHDYTVTAGKVLHLKQIESSSSGKAKMELQIETGVASGTFVSKAVQFNSTASPNMSVLLQADLLVAAGVRVRVIMINRDKQAEDLYSSIIGFEI